MTRANINFVYQNMGEAPRTLFIYHNGDQYPTGMRDYFHVLDFTEGNMTPERFKAWILMNYEKEVEDLGEGGQPKIYYTDGFCTDYSYVFTAEGTISVWSWKDLIFDGNKKEFKKWILKQE